MSVTLQTSESGAVLQNEYVRLEVRLADDGHEECLFARTSDGWAPILNLLKSAGDPLDTQPILTRCSIAVQSKEKASLLLEGRKEGRSYRVMVTLEAAASYLRYRVEESFDAPVICRSLMSRYGFSADSVDFSFASHLRPSHNQVIGQFAFKSPALIVQKDRLLAALIADVDRIDPDNAQLLCLEPDVSCYDDRPPMVAFGFKNHEPHGLIYFQHRSDMLAMLEPQTREYGYIVYVSADAEPRYGYRAITRLLWTLFGEASFEKLVPQVVSMDRYGDYALDYAIPTLWRDLPKGGESCGGMLMGIKFPNDIWFHFFFNHLHTAFGLYRMGQRRGRPDLIDKARSIRNLILSAPRRDGAIPAIFSYQIVNGIRRDEWIPHAHWVGGSIPYQTQIPKPPDQPAYSTLDGSWTAYWMLRWVTELEDDKRLIAVAKEYGELLLRVQLPSGAVPVWLDKETLEPVLMLRESPSCAASGLLLAKLYNVTRDRRFLEAARRVAAFIEKRCMPQGWTDYECFFDSAGKPVDLVDPYSGQRPQCTFPIFWTSQLGKELYEATSEECYREQALRAVDYLLLFQGIWSPPYLTVKGFGSIGIGNGHTGWNDARSGIFAPFIAEFFSLGGNAEYLKRGVAAMRAPLALMYMPENAAVSSVFDKGPTGYADECYAHRGRDARLGPSTFDFSVGYALMAYEELHLVYGAAYLNLETGVNVGIDGCSVAAVHADATSVDVRISDGVSRGRCLDVVIDRGKAENTRVEVFSQTMP